MIPNFSQIAIELNNEQNFQTRLKAISKLANGYSDAEESLQLLLTALKDPYFRVREKAVIALAKMYDPRVIEPLVAAVTDIPTVRDAALESLQARTLSTEILTRISSYLDSYSLYKRRKKLNAQPPFSTKDSLDALSEAASDPDFLIREAAVRSLSSFGDERAFSILISACNDFYLSVREAALHSIRSLPGPFSTPLLTSALKTTNWVLFDVLVDLMLDRNYENTTDVLINVLQEDNFVIRRRARAGLSRICTDSTLSSLVGSLALWDARDMHIPAYIMAQFYKEGLFDHLSCFSHAMVGMMGSIVERDWPAGIEALNELASLKEWRHMAFFFTADIDRRNRFDVTSALDNTFDTQRQKADKYLCTEHLARFRRYIHEGNRYLACRICKQTHLSIKVSKVVLVIDSSMDVLYSRNDDTYFVNWLAHRRRMDFDSVEIGTCSEDFITDFCIEMGNDTDSYRNQKYATASCYLRPGSTLSIKAMNLLRTQFKKVVSV